MAKRKTREPSFEQAMQELEEVVEKMEAGDLPLDESLSLFERGVSLTRQCQSQLKTAEQKVQQLMKTSEGENLEPFESSDGESSDGF